MKKKKRLLTNRDKEILRFIERYRIGTSQLIARTIFRDPKQKKAAGRVLLRLTRSGYLRRRPLYGNQYYVVLTRRGCRGIGVPERTPRPLTEQSLPVVLAIAHHCTRTGLSRMTDREFREQFPELWRPGLRSSAYAFRETEKGLTLCMFLVDRGGTPRRIKGKIRRVISQRDSLPAFAALIAAGRFRVCVLTGLTSQRTQIRRRLGRMNYRNVGVDVEAVPEMAEYLTWSQ